MEFGHWDSAEHNDVINYQSLLTQFYRILKKGGVCIMFWDLWKIQDLANMFKKAGFKQLRFIEWIKTNPVPINSRCNYLTNAREVAVLGVKVGKSTFNAKYHNGVYKFPIEHSKDRWHPTQKSLKLFEELIKTHTKEGEIVLDPFLGSGTTAVAAIKLNRIAYGSELEKSYFEKILKRIKGI
jgi:site-specific DNA-methyltransferase (adenine-specific)